MELKGKLFQEMEPRWSQYSGGYPLTLDDIITVPFRLIRPSRVTGPVVLAEFGHLSRVTTPLADDFWWIQKTVKKAFKDIFTGVGHMQHFFLHIYLRTTLIDQ